MSSILLAMNSLILLGVIVCTIAALRGAVVASKASQMAASELHTNHALAALMRHNNQVEPAIADLMAHMDQTARAVIQDREGTAYKQWVRDIVTHLHDTRAQKPQ